MGNSKMVRSWQARNIFIFILTFLFAQLCLGNQMYSYQRKGFPCYNLDKVKATHYYPMYGYPGHPIMPTTTGLDYPDPRYPPQGGRKRRTPPKPADPHHDSPPHGLPHFMDPSLQLSPTAPHPGFPYHEVPPHGYPHMDPNLHLNPPPLHPGFPYHDVPPQGYPHMDPNLHSPPPHPGFPSHDFPPHAYPHMDPSLHSNPPPLHPGFPYHDFPPHGFPHYLDPSLASNPIPLNPGFLYHDIPPHGYPPYLHPGVPSYPIPLNPGPSRCYQPLNPGSGCLARMIRWYYNAKNNRCEMFFYVGCKGNSNNFYSKEECERTCMGTPHPEFPPHVYPYYMDPSLHPIRAPLTPAHFDNVLMEKKMELARPNKALFGKVSMRKKRELSPANEALFGRVFMGRNEK